MSTFLHVLIGIPCTFIALMVTVAMVMPFVEHQQHLKAKRQRSKQKQPSPKKKLPKNVVPINKKRAQLMHEIIDLEIERKINQ